MGGRRREGGHHGEGGHREERKVIVGREATEGEKGIHCGKRLLGEGCALPLGGGGTLLTVNTLQWTSNR